MRRLLAGLALLFALAAPAHAAITQIVGSGTGGNIGASPSGGVVTTNATVHVGDLVVVGVSIRSVSTTVTGCTDAAGNTYTVVSASGVPLGNGAICYSRLTTQLLSGGTVTISVSGTGGADVIASAFTGVSSGTLLDPASPTPIIGNSSTYNAGTSTTLAGAGEVAVVSISGGSNTSVTPTSGFTTLGTDVSANFVYGEFKLLSTTAAVTGSPVGTVSQNYGGIMLIFEAAVGGGGTTPAGLTTMGVGP